MEHGIFFLLLRLLFAFGKLGKVESALSDGFLVKLPELVIFITAYRNLVEGLCGFGKRGIFVEGFWSVLCCEIILIVRELLIVGERFFGCFFDDVLFGRRGFESIAFLWELAEVKLFASTDGNLVKTVGVSDEL